MAPPGQNPRKLPSGRWQARIRDSAGQNRYQSFDRKIDADRWLDAHRGARATGQQINPAGERTRFGDVAAEWMETREASTRPATLALYRGHLDRHILPTFADVPVGAIRRADIQRWTNRLVRPKPHGAELAPSTAETVYRVLAAVLRHAVDERLVSSSEARRIQLPQRVETHHSIVPITVDQLGRLAEAAGEWGRLVWFAASTGMRQGECLGLTYDRVNAHARTVRVDRQMVTPNAGEPAFGPPKTTASNRTIPVGDATLRWVGDGAAGDLVFPGPDGRPWRRQRASAAFNTWTATAGLDGVTFHDLRHFYASMLIAGGASVKVVQARLGHATADETLNTYSHLWPSDQDVTRRIVDAVLAHSMPDDGSRGPMAT